MHASSRMRHILCKATPQERPGCPKSNVNGTEMSEVSAAYCGTRHFLASIG